MDPVVECRYFSDIHEVEDFLRMEVKIARIQREEANLRFWHISAEISCSDHDEQVTSAARVQCLARISLVMALKRLNAFLDRGTIPREFRVNSPVTERHKSQVA